MFFGIYKWAVAYHPLIERTKLAPAIIDLLCISISLLGSIISENLHRRNQARAHSLQFRRHNCDNSAVCDDSHGVYPAING